jgi:pimeloyl-ACP methyl ester carboxylesterase
MNRRTFLGIGLAAGTAAFSDHAQAHPATSPAAALGADEFARRRRYAATVFGDIAYVEAGRGPACLFLHGFPLNGFQWRSALEALAPYRRCIAPDFLGMGYTRVARDADMTPATQTRMLVALLDRLGIGQSDVIANDSGGAVAQLLLARYPERIRSLLLSNCDSEIECPPAAMGPVIDLARQGGYAREWLVPWRRDPARARAADGIGGMCYARPTNPTDEAVATYFTPLVNSEARLALTDRFALALTENSLAGTGSILRATKVPVGIAWGMADSIFSREGLEHLSRTFGNLRQVEHLEGYKLLWPEERPDVIRDQALRLWGA